MQLLKNLRTFAWKLLKPKRISGKTVRLTIDTDGQMFLCRLPELSLSAAEPTIAEAYDNLQRQIRAADFVFAGNTDQEILFEIAAIQRTEVFNRSVRKKSVIFLGISVLFFFLTIAIVPATVNIMNLRGVSSLEAQNYVTETITRVAQRIEDIDPANEAKIQAELSTIRTFLVEMLSGQSSLPRDN